jgi:hypothetical protein
VGNCAAAYGGGVRPRLLLGSVSAVLRDSPAALHLANLGLTDDGGKALAAVLLAWPADSPRPVHRFTAAYLQHAELTSVGIAAVGAGLARCPALRELSVRWN